MTNTENQEKRHWLGLIPRKGRALVGFIVIVVLAFSLGVTMSGDGKTSSGDPVATATQESDSTAQEATLWTCSMHPQIKLPHPGKCPICFMDLIPLKPSTDQQLKPNQLVMTPDAVALAGIQTSPVTRGIAENEVRMVGKIDYDETNVAYITAWVPGRLDHLYADFTGTTVRKGEKLVHLYSPELLSAQEELIQAKQTYAKMQAADGVLASTSKKTLEAARDKLRLFGLTESQIAGIESSGKANDHLTIYSPIGGVVVHKNAVEGMYVNTGTQIYTIADLSRLWALFDAYESDLPWLREGQKVEFTSLSLPGEKFTGIISFIDPVVDQKTRTIRVRAIVNNESGRLKPEMFVSGLVKAGMDRAGNPMRPDEEHGADGKPLMIPASAPLLTGTRAVVYVKLESDGDPVFEGREVTLGPRAGNYYVVESGLEEGELVVTNGAFRIDSELQIQAKPSMMSPEHNTGPEPQSPAFAQMVSATMTESETDAAGESPASNPAATKAITPIYDAYFDLQMALAGDDLAAAKKAFRNVTNRTTKVDMELFFGHMHQRWMKYAAELVKDGAAGEEASNLAAARDAFYAVSVVMIDMEKSFGHGDKRDYYLTFCPMAHDNKGAYWLQTVDTVYNSFYGNMMLRCGSIEDTLPALGKK
jgi:Cu(I)/Ag(I) efflux system membrane fusion protein